MKIDWENVKGIDDKKSDGFRSRVIYRDGAIEQRAERFQDLSRIWRGHLRTRQGLAGPAS